MAWDPTLAAAPTAVDADKPHVATLHRDVRLPGGAFPSSAELATDPVARRSTFRDGDFPARRQIPSGFRTAGSA